MKDSASIIVDTMAARRAAMGMVQNCAFGMICTIKKANRTDKQNRLLWPLLGEIARQVKINGQHDPDWIWKDRFMHGLGQEMAFTHDLQGRHMIPLGRSTSVLSKAQFGDLIELIYAYGAEKGVTFRRDKDDVMAAADDITKREPKEKAA